MGAWGTSLYVNDSTCDVRDTYLGFLEKQSSNQEAYEKILEKCCEYIGDQDAPLFWFSLAETQWRVGRLMPEVKEKALDWIEKSYGAELWGENKKCIIGWKKTLEKLRLKLESTPPKEKLFRKINIPFQNPWELNDVYAYRIHNKCYKPEGDIARGKYILMQKIGEGNGFESADTVMRVQIFDRLFDDMPSIDDVHDTICDFRLLPFSYPPDQVKRYKLRLLGKPDPFDMSLSLCRYDPVMMSAKLEQPKFKQQKHNCCMFYPNNELSYICTVESPLNKQHDRRDANDDQFCWWENINNRIGWWFVSWQGIDYDVIGDGTFEYPTLEHQKRIRHDLMI